MLRLPCQEAWYGTGRTEVEADVNAVLRRMLAAAAAAAAAVAARQAAELGWTLVKDEPPPTAEGVTGDTELRDLLLWSGLVAVAVMLARRIAIGRTERLLGPSEDD